jgi:hypothetical protein
LANIAVAIFRVNLFEGLGSIFTLKLATAVFTEKENLQYSTQLIPESQTYTHKRHTVWI